MQLPNDSIGISDLIAHRECPRRMSYGLRRHVGPGLQSDAKTPEAGSKATSYGSAIHDVIQRVEEGDGDEQAISYAWRRWGYHLDPGDIDLLKRDLEVYRGRDMQGVRTLAAEDEFRVPLFKHPTVGQVYFRFKLDRLYERIDAPGHFIMVDYKSSKWAKSAAEVHEDLQMWAYNWGIHELWPECVRLSQVYDQLRYGQIPTRKTHAQREQMREWLILAAIALIEDEDWQPDGLLSPRKNRWCAWCPVMESCPVIPELTEFARVEIEALAPSEIVGRKIQPLVERDRIEEYLERFEDVKAAIGVLERFRDAVAELVRGMPEEDRVDHGYDLKSRSATKFTPESARQLHERLGSDFYEIVKLTKTGLESGLSDDPELLEWALALAEKTDGAEVLLRR